MDSDELKAAPPLGATNAMARVQALVDSGRITREQGLDVLGTLLFGLLPEDADYAKLERALESLEEDPPT